MTNINIEIPDDLHKKAKRRALDSNITLKQLIIESISKEIIKIKI